MLFRFVRPLYVAWGFFWFIVPFLLFYPLIWLIIQREKWHRYYFPIARLWATIFYGMMFLPVKSIWKFKPEKGKVYVFCPNHFSYLDIALLTRTLHAFYAFVGLHDLKRFPLFGYMYKHLHITVDRSSAKDRHRTYQRYKEALQKGKQLVVFPEGGIWAKNPPNMANFKEGPFKVAIEMQVPIVPVTIPYNWRILYTIALKSFHWHRSVVVFHEPIPTIGLTLQDVNMLKEKTFQMIAEELMVWNKSRK
ncbi:MAG: 1-acyl-sn-glycerol-3-phosphate acyltransferase [Cytophagales bacterium]|nr:MAG: 1-acyl-sn-glycerol-3-phosphate acyltransferase [Cytophagales bacterium]